MSKKLQFAIDIYNEEMKDAKLLWDSKIHPACISLKTNSHEFEEKVAAVNASHNTAVKTYDKEVLTAKEGEKAALELQRATLKKLQIERDAYGKLWKNAADSSKNLLSAFNTPGSTTKRHRLD